MMTERSEKSIEKLQLVTNRRKPYYSTLVMIAALVVFCTVYSLILPAITLTTSSEDPIGNPALSYMMYNSNNIDSTYRAYLEYALDGTGRSVTFGVPRRSVMYVYAYAGETICLGSDVTASRLTEEDAVESTPTGVDILMIGPDGTKYTFDNDAETGLGYIGDTTQEKNGANYTGRNEPNGYTPHEFIVRTTGIYEVRFHSYTGNYADGSGDGSIPHLRKTITTDQAGATAGGKGEPVFKFFKENNWCNSGNTVGAFDITVVSNGRVKTGRTFADYLAFNLGLNKKTTSTLYGDFYMVTGDGYIYRSKFNLDPFAFVFFGNNRGIIDEATGYSAYCSVRGRGQDSNAQIDMTGLNYTVFTPQNSGTELDQTVRIFFELPDPDLEGILFGKAFAPEKVDSVSFIGAKQDNITYVGNGGYFKFDIQNASSVAIVLSFAEYNRLHGTNYADYTTTANVKQGTNYVYWNGDDGAGQVIPPGWYEAGQAEISIHTRTGEFHFPFLDVENANGVSFERVNKIYDYVDGILTDVTEDFDSTRFLVYYNNTIYPDKRNSPKDNIIADGLDRSNGIDSSSYVMSFLRNSTGDYTILDVWTYTAERDQNVPIRTDLIVEDLQDYFSVNLNGKVFFDKDNSSRYDLMGGDFPLEGVEVTLDYNYCETRWTVESDPNDEDGILRLHPAGDTSSTVDEQGNTVEVVNYYYHDYEIRRETNEASQDEYYIYKYDSSDRLHTGEATPLYDGDGNRVKAVIDQVESFDQTLGFDVTSYLVWIPVHKETVTDSLGQYYFLGVLINENFYDCPEGKENFVINVKNPSPELYTVTTSEVSTGDFGTTGTEQQMIGYSDIVSKIRADTAGRRIFFFNVADVGYFYDTKNIIVAKHWGTVHDSDDVEEITFLLQGYVNDGASNIVCYEREVTVDFHDWQKELNDLPLSTNITGSEQLINYRIVSETYRKSDGYTYKYSYDWDEGVGEYSRIQYIDDGNGHISTVDEVIAEEDYPYTTYISELKTNYQGDVITVENWASSTSKIKITKIAAQDNVTRLPQATFKLQKLDTTTGNYTNVMTTTGIYTVTTDANGEAEFHGLSAGKYRLVESVAPSGYEPVQPIIFTVSSTGGTENEDVTGNYFSGYETTIYDNLSDAPASKIKKYDQYGNPVSGAEFKVYPTDEDYIYDPNSEPAFIMTTDNEGTAVFMITRSDGTEREMYISELTTMLSGKRNFVLVETEVPDGYRRVGEGHMKIVGSGMESYVICENPYESGIWASPSASVYAGETLKMTDMSQYDKVKNASNIDSDGKISYVNYSNNGQISAQGTLFAVILKRNGAEPQVGNLREITGNGWVPVYGDSINGFHTVSGYSDTIEAVMEVVENGGATEFFPSPDLTSMHAHISNFPGLLTEYYTYYFENNIASEYSDLLEEYVEPQYLVAYYYTTASSLSGATKDNTVQVSSHGLYDEAEPFQVHWSTTIDIPDIVNSLYVQKRDTDGNLVEDAVFSLYNAVKDANGNGYYIGENETGEVVYIRLSEDESLTATVYNGTVTDSIFTPSGEAEEGTYTINDEGCADLPSSDTGSELIASLGGYVGAGTTDVGQITVTTESGVYIISTAKDAKQRSCAVFTHDTCSYVDENGTAHLQYLPQGYYLLKEIYAPLGFKLNYTNVEVVVNDTEVYANAGDRDDGVRVGNGAGYLVSTMNVYASIGDINETLSYIVAALRLDASDSASAGFADLTDVGTWPYVKLDQNDTTKYIFDGTEETGGIRDATVLYLRYNGNANSDDNMVVRKTLFDYTVSPEAANDPSNVINSLMYWTEAGWSDLAIFQHITYARQMNPENSNTKFTDISLKSDGVTENDISNLFSSSTFVSFEDTGDIGLKVVKTSSTTGRAISGADFVLYYTEDGINRYYTKDNNSVEWIIPDEEQSKEDYAISVSENGELLFEGLDAGVYYLEETKAPTGYTGINYRIRITVAGGIITASREDGTPITATPPDITDLSGGYNFTITVPNSTGYELPATGGRVDLFYTFGTALIVVAGALMLGYMLRRKREGRVVE